LKSREDFLRSSGISFRQHDGISRSAHPNVRKIEVQPGSTGLDDDNMLTYNVIMIRTQVSLSAEEYRAAKREAQRLGISLAELLRRSLRTILPVDPSAPWMRYAGMIETGDAESSRRIDEIVYGQKP
jgi:hypothetical protein